MIDRASTMEETNPGLPLPTQNGTWEGIKSFALYVFAGIERIGESVAAFIGKSHFSYVYLRIRDA